jgi:hypothetical protein
LSGTEGRYYSERSGRGFKAHAVIRDRKGKQRPLYADDVDRAHGLVRELNDLQQFRGILGNVVTAKNIISVMLAIEEAEDEQGLRDACDKNRELLLRLKVGGITRYKPQFIQTPERKDATRKPAEKNSAEQEDAA